MQIATGIPAYRHKTRKSVKSDVLIQFRRNAPIVVTTILTINGNNEAASDGDRIVRRVINGNIIVHE